MNLPVKLKHVMILCGEPSGDYHASRLVNDMRRQFSGICFTGIGGPNLQAQKVNLFYDIGRLSAMGVTEVLLQFRYIKQAFSLFRSKLKEHPPDLLILVDYPGFNLKAAEYAKNHLGIQVFYYITPKVWAWKKSRLKTIKKYVDHAALILPFEEKIFKSAGISATYVGNPLIDDYPESLTKPYIPGIDAAQNQKNEQVIGLLPGSRRAEVNKLMPVMLETAMRISRHKRVRFIISKSDSISLTLLNLYLDQVPDRELFEIYSGPVRDIFIKSNLLIAASGTVTLEAALACVPTILVYKMSPLTYKLARFFVRVKYAGLANLVVNREVMPEFLQENANPENLTAKTLEMLENQTYYQSELKKVRRFLGKKGAASRAASIAVYLMNQS